MINMLLSCCMGGANSIPDRGYQNLIAEEQLKLDKGELLIDAKKEGIKLDIDRKNKEDKNNIEILKTMK